MVPIKREICWHLEVRKEKQEGGGEIGGESAPACWEQLEELGSGRGHDPGGTTVTRRWKFLQLLSGSFVYFIKQLQMLCCFTAAYPAQPGGTFTTVLYGQIICTIKALMMTWNESQWRSITEPQHAGKNRGQQRLAKYALVLLMSALRKGYCVTFGTKGLLSSSSDTITQTDHASEMKCCDADDVTRGKRIYLNMPETMSNPYILRH